jgi:3-oxoacyl-[acyl-carrier protein] reductase
MNETPADTKTACVTGASRGLGRAVAEIFLSSGWKVAIAARDKDRLEDTARSLCANCNRNSSDIIVLAFDMSLKDSARRCFEELKKHWRKLDALVNNAGIQGPIGRFCDTDGNEWKSAFETLLFAPLDMCREAIPWMVSTGGGDIVNLSGGGAASPRGNFSSYAAAKTALVRTTEILALEYAEADITVNTVAPGAMPTDMLSSVMTAGRNAAGESEYAAARRAFESGSDEALRRAARCIYALCSQKRPKVTGRLFRAAWDPWETLERHAETIMSEDIYTLRRVTPRGGKENRETGA